jgi:hypothetical protein
MSWQEELQQLDTELAQGRVTPEDYRQRRDQLMGLAQQSMPQQTPQQPEQPNGPFAAPFRWQPSNPGSGPVESPQVMRPIGENQPAQDNAERTQVVRGAGQDDNAERTQVVRGGPQPPPQQNPPLQPYQGLGMQQQGGWNQTPPGNTTPWGDEDLSPPNPNDISWMRQGPEVFHEDSGSKGKVIGSIAVVILLLGAAFGAYMLWGRGPSTPEAGNQTTTQAPTTTTKPVDPLMAELPGTTLIQEVKQVKDWAGVKARNYLDYLTSGSQSSEVAAYEAGNPGAVRFAMNKNGDDKIIVLVVKESSADAAKQVTEQLGKLQTGYGQKQLTVQPGVLATGLDNVPGDTPVMRRAHYASGSYVVRIEVRGVQVPATDKDFHDVLALELAKLAAHA